MSDTIKWPNWQQSRFPYRRSVIISQEQRSLSFDIMNPLSRSKGAETENLNLLFRWLRVFFLLAVVVDGMEESIV